MIRTGLFTVSSLLGLAVAASVSLSACSSGDVAVGSTDQTLKNTEQTLQRSKSGTPTGNGTTCWWDDSVSSDGTYNVGEKFLSLDGCNICSCAPAGIMCTKHACAPGAGICSYAGKTYAANATFKATDGCNSCSCASDGSVACTELGCPTVSPCMRTGCTNQLCADHVLGGGCGGTGVDAAKWGCYGAAACEPQADGQCGFTPSPALAACLAASGPWGPPP